MAPKHEKKDQHRVDIATQNFTRGYEALRQHPMFAPLVTATSVSRQPGNRCPPDGWAVVTGNGVISVHPTRRGHPDEWQYVLAHCLLHLGWGHFQSGRRLREWNAACDCCVTKFLTDLKLGRPPEDLRHYLEVSIHTEDRLYQEFCVRGIPDAVLYCGTAGPRGNDMLREPAPGYRWRRTTDWPALFGKGLVAAVTSAVNVAAGLEPHLGSDENAVSPAQRARRWFISSYPLLGSLSAAFEIIEDPQVCLRLNIAVAAVDAESQEIFMNPVAGLSEDECRFVMAHELLHVGLRHQVRRRGRDPFLWNVACDYVVNGWLVEMGVGQLPMRGVLYDPVLQGESAEGIYDRLVTDLRRSRKLATLRGVGLGDMLERSSPDWWSVDDGLRLDDFYRRCLRQGLIYHQDEGRGFLPAGLIEEIRALSHPPLPWDVELAQWFDAHFPPLEKVRTFARPSRRQSATPDIPRAHWVLLPEEIMTRTFGVIVDTSGSMDRTILAKALGAITSYSLAREVPAVRVVFCDAAPYDQGYLAPDDLAGRVQVKGRGGTVLQPAINLLEKAKDFPEDGPLLIITDGDCDRLRIRREHAFLLPEGRSLPFVPQGKVFRMRA